MSYILVDLEKKRGIKFTDLKGLSRHINISPYKIKKMFKDEGHLVMRTGWILTDNVEEVKSRKKGRILSASLVLV